MHGTGVKLLNRKEQSNAMIKQVREYANFLLLADSNIVCNGILEIWKDSQVLLFADSDIPVRSKYRTFF